MKRSIVLLSGLLLLLAAACSPAAPNRVFEAGQVEMRVGESTRWPLRRWTMPTTP